MAKTYTACSLVQCRKLHTCVDCGAKFHYHFQRNIKKTSGSEAGARKAIEKAVSEALEKEVDQHPCPGCGRYQPDMVGLHRVKRYQMVVWGALVVLPAIVILGASRVLTYDRASMACAAASLVILLLQVVTTARNPNRDLRANREAATREVEAGSLVVLPQEEQAAVFEESIENPVSTPHKVALAMITVACAVMLAPVLAANALGWQTNPALYPPVVGPGDKADFYFVEQVQCVKGLWHATGHIELLNAQDLGKDAESSFDLVSRTESWGGVINVKDGEKHTRHRPWATVRVGNNANLPGKTARLKLVLRIVYPTMVGNGFNDTMRDMTEFIELKLSSARAGALYMWLWWGGAVSGALLVLVGSYMLSRMANALCATALPVVVLPTAIPRQSVES